MREASFIEQNKEKWLEIEHNLKHKNQIHPDKLASDYIELTNDLAYSQTFYPTSKTKDYLNELSVFAHQSIYKDQKSSNKHFLHFFKYDVPKAVFENQRYLLYSLLITTLATLIGIISSHYDTEFTRLILGGHYVDTTIENIKNGNPAAIYQSGSATGSAIAITINNIRVAFLAFAFGVFFSVGSGYILFTNGVMLGAFHYIFYKFGVLGTAMSA
ncbi:MAG TPA: stage II sporulation protein M, partial [Crocinitomicaceae bacterium]|nr:stage II sporulation protein M [Crocinitomicaceae bacterium]